MSLFSLGSFKLHSGMESNWKIDCGFLSDDDIVALAMIAATAVPPFVSVQGVIRGGLRLARALERYRSKDGSHHLIVDDVLTTGKSMEEARKEYLRHRALWDNKNTREVCGAVIFARGGVKQDWIRVLFQCHVMV